MRKILLVNDKDYSVVGKDVYCNVNYNQFFEPLNNYFEEVHIAGRRRSESKELPFRLNGAVFHGLPTFASYVDFVKKYRLGLSGIKARKALADAIKSVDVVYLTLGSYFARDVESLCRRYKKPLMVEVIDDAISAITQTTKYKGVTRKLALSVAYKMDRYYKNLCENYPSLILGKELYERYRPSGSVACAEFFENLMEEEDYSFGKPLFIDKKIKLLFVGRLVAMKAVEDLVLAVSQLVSRGCDVQCRIIGYGDTKEQLVSQVKNLKLEKNIEFVGFVKYGEEMFAQYEWADVFVLPSVGGEGVPRVLIEALGRGCLVVATDVCGVSTIVKGGQTGLLVQPRNPLAIADAIQSLNESESLRNKVLAGAKAFCLEHTRTKQIEMLHSFISEHVR